MATTVEHTIGTGGDYATIAAWLTATANPIADDAIYIGRLKSETHALSANNTTIAGNSDATRNRVLTFETAPYSLLDDSGPKITYTRSTGGTTLVIGQYEQLIGVGVFETYSSATGGRGITAIAGGGLIDGVTHVVDGSSSTTPAGDHNGFSAYAGATIRNCIFVDKSTAGAKDGYYVRQGAVCHNCVSYNAGDDGFWHNYGGATITNCVAIGSVTDDFKNIAAATVSYCASSDTTATGTGSVTSTTAAACFEDASGDDFRPKDAGPLDDAGSDLSGTFTTDILGDTRSIWSIGAYDAPPVAAGVTAHIKKNLSTTEYAPAHFAFSAWDSTPVSGGIHECLVKWTVSGGSEHDGVYYGHNLGFGWTTAGTFTVQLDVTDAGGNTGTTSTTVTVATPTYDNEIYVSSAGSDSNDGLTSGAPKLTVSAAWTALKAAHSAGEHSVMYLRKGDTFTENMVSSDTILAVPSSGSGTFYFEAYGSGVAPIIRRTGTAGRILLQRAETGREFGVRLRGVHLKNETDQYVCDITTDDSDLLTKGYDFVAVDTTLQTTSGSGIYLFHVFSTQTRDATTYPDEPGFSSIGNFCAQGCTLIAYSRPSDGSYYGIYGGGRWVTLTECDFYHADYGTGVEYQHLMRFVWAQFHQYRDCSFHGRSSYGSTVRWQTAGQVLSPWTVSNRNTIVGCSVTHSNYGGIETAYVDEILSSIAADVKHGCYMSILNNKFAEDSAHAPLLDNWRSILIGGDAVAVVGNTLVAPTTRPFFVMYNDDRVVSKGTERILIANNSIDIGTSTGSVMEIGEVGGIGWLDGYGVVTVRNNAVSGGISLVSCPAAVAADVAANLTIDNNVADCTYWSQDIGESGTKTLAQWQTYSSQDASSSASSPSFADPANDDWSIGVDSPCYDAGATIVASTITREGTERSGTWDIGAFEIPAASPTSENMSGYLNLANIRVRAGQTLAMAFTGTGNAKGRYILTVELE